MYITLVKDVQKHLILLQSREMLKSCLDEHFNHIIKSNLTACGRSFPSEILKYE